MASTEQAIRITAQGEFGQLQRGLKDLQDDFKNVLGTIEKGTRQGGFFDDKQLQALDLYRRRFKDTLEELDKEFDKQSDAVEALSGKMKTAYAWEKEELKEQIKQRQENLGLIDDTRRKLEQAYQKRNTEAESYGSSSPIPSGSGGSGSGGNDSGSSFAMLGASSLIPKALGAIGTIGKFALGLAGVGSLLSMATEAYQLAHSREVNSLDLSQRLRGNGFSGSNDTMYDNVSAIGRSNKMGYSQAESWQLQDTYTSEAGTLGDSGQLALQKFSRGYGLDATTVGGLAGNAKQLGGVEDPKKYADMIATSVEKSGMTPRILEVMKTSNALLQNLNTTFKDGSTAQIMSYQTTLDRLGNANGMTKLTGAQGANVIGGLGGIYQPDNEKWKWMGITALQQYNPKKYSQMSLYDQESSFEDGIQNKDNIPAMAKYLKSTSGGDNDNFKRMMQSWLTDGGFKATKSEVTELDKVTNGFTAFDPDKIDKVLGTDSGTKYDTTRKDEAGQNIMDVEAVFNKHLEELGTKFLPFITTMQGDINNIVTDLGSLSSESTLQNVYKLLKEGLGKDLIQFMKDSKLDKIVELMVAGFVGKKGVEALWQKYKSNGTEAEPTDTAEGSGSPDRQSELEQRANAQETISNGETTASTTEGIGNRTLNADETAMLDSTAQETGLNRANLERAYRSNGDNGVDQFVNSGGQPPEGAVPERSGSALETPVRGSAAQDSATPTTEITAPTSEVPAPSTGGVSGASSALSKFNKIAPPALSLLAMADTFGLIDGKQKPTPRYAFVAPGSDQEKKAEKNDLEMQKKMGIKHPDLSPRAFDPLNSDSTKILEELGNKGELALDGFSTYGKQQLEKLQSEGLLKFTDLKTSGSATLSNLSANGETALLALQDNGSISLGGLQKDGTLQVTALTEDGKKSLEKLKTDGVVEMSDFHKEGKVQITSLSTEGAKHLQELKKGGSVDLEGMHTDSTAKMELIRKDTADNNIAIFNEHKGIGDRIAEFFKPLTDLWNKLMSKFGLGTGGSETSGNGSISKNSDVRKDSGATANSLNGKLRGKLSGYGDDYVEAGKKYGIDPAFLASVSMQETGNGNVVTGNNVGGMMKSNGSGLMSFGSMSEGINAMASNLKTGYIDQGLTTPEEIQKKYAPEGAGNDPNNLNSNWLSGVTSFYGQTAGTSGGGGDAFKNWQDNITSPFGAKRVHNGQVSYHSGLDIAEKQGTTLNALAGGKLTDITMDDGGQYDPDHKANTRIGGSQITVTMANGKSYTYEHMSQVNADLLAEYEAGNHSIEIASGANLGKSGGDPSIAGSGDPNYTTGAHLHLGYTDADGKAQDPADLLKSLDTFDTGGFTGDWGGSDGKLAMLHQKEIILNANDTPNFLKALDTSKEILNQNQQSNNTNSGLNLDDLLKSFSTENVSTTSSSVGSSGTGVKPSIQESRITVDVNIKGEKVSQLNNVTVETLKALVQQGIEAYKRQQLAMNPTATGW